jgi:O-antigen/teichoic acid export membrane protein
VGRRILGNFLALGGAQLVTMATGVVTAVVLARALGPAVYGIIGFGVAVLSYFGLLVNMGMDVHGVREISRRPEHGNRLAGMILSTRFVFAILLYAALFAAVPLFGWSDEVRRVLLIQGIGMFGVALTLDFYYQAEQRMAVAALRQGGAAIVGAIAVFTLIKAPEDIYIAASVPVAVQVASALVLLLFFHATRQPQQDIEGAPARGQFIRRAAPVALITVLGTIYINMDIVILGYMVPEHQVGLYVAASRVAMISVVFQNLAHSAFLPALSKAFGDDAAASSAAANHARSVSYFGGAVGGAGMLLAPAIVVILFGVSYAEAAPALTILMANVLAFHLGAAYGTPILAWRCDKPYMVILGVGAAANIILNLVLIPAYGIVGAAIATAVTQILILIALMALARKAFNLRQYGLMVRTLAITALSVGAVWVAIKIIGGGVGPWPLLILAGALYVAIYSVLAIASGIISLPELRALIKRDG